MRHHILLVGCDFLIVLSERTAVLLVCVAMRASLHHPKPHPLVSPCMVHGVNITNVFICKMLATEWVWVSMR